MFIDPAAGDCWHREFPGTNDQVREVRVFAAALLAGCPFLDDVLLGVDELAANTIRHTRSGEPGGRFTVGVRRWYGENGKETQFVAVSVRDQGGPCEPVADVRDLNDEDFWVAESGRGLWTVSRTAVSWGWFGNSVSRTVSAVFAASELLVCAA